jgi:hypothetical protein
MARVRDNHHPAPIDMIARGIDIQIKPDPIPCPDDIAMVYNRPADPRPFFNDDIPYDHRFFNNGAS